MSTNPKTLEERYDEMRAATVDFEFFEEPDRKGQIRAQVDAMTEEELRGHVEANARTRVTGGAEHFGKLFSEVPGGYVRWCIDKDNIKHDNLFALIKYYLCVKRLEA